VILYLDASALVELVFQERDIEGLLVEIARADHIVTAVISLPEAACALARARRGGRLAMDHRRALKELQSSWQTLARVSIDEPVAHAVHLAVAVEANRTRPVTLASWDQELLVAARASPQGLGHG
jgi:uncharacterized protein with PIN domain